MPPGGGLLDICVDPAVLPGWLTAHDISVFAAEYATAGFTGGLNWYRNLDRNWELTAAWHGAPVTVPALYLAGERDLVVNFPGARELLPRMREYIPQLRGHGAAARLRPLDPAGAARRGQRGDDRLPARPGLTGPVSRALAAGSPPRLRASAHSSA